MITEVWRIYSLIFTVLYVLYLRGIQDPFFKINKIFHTFNRRISFKLHITEILLPRDYMRYNIQRNELFDRWNIWQEQLKGWGRHNIRFRNSFKNNIFLSRTFPNWKKLRIVDSKLTKYSILKLFNRFSYDFVHVISLHSTSAGCCDALSVRYFACQIVHFAV